MIPPLITCLPANTERNAAFAHWIVEYCTSESLVLDIGAGRDRTNIDTVLAPHVKLLVGVDPSEDILINQAVHERHRSCMEDFARDEQRQFDVLFATMVLEHITEPDAFFTACRSLLKPKGMFFAVTPNLWHHFGLLTATSNRLGLEDWILDRVMGKAGKAEYHFPTAYRINSVRSIRELLTRAGFHSVEFRCFDNPRTYNYIIPKPMRWFPRLYSHLAYQLHLTSFMGTLMIRAVG